MLAKIRNGTVDGIHLIVAWKEPQDLILQLQN